MTDWRTLAANGLYDQIDWLDLDPDARSAYLRHLRAVVPRVTVMNGMERENRHATPAEMETIRLEAARLKKLSADERQLERERLIEASKVLFLGELAAAVERAPEDGESWRSTRGEAEAFLRELVAAPEVTAGDPTLSRQQHARDALECLQGIDRAVDWLLQECDDPDERHSLREAVAVVAERAFVAGRHLQAAWGKDFEHLAVSRERQISALRHRNEGRSQHNATRRREKEEHARKAKEIAATSKLAGMALAQYVANQLKKPENGGIARSPKTVHRWLNE